MSNNRYLTRDQLAEFLPNHKAVRAFEQLFVEVSEVISSTGGNLEAALGTGRAPNTNVIERRIDFLESMKQPRSTNLVPVERRLELLEQLQQSKVNLTPILQRTETIEIDRQRSVNLNDILNRLAALEAFVGI